MIVTTLVVPDTNTIGVVGAMVVALAMVGAAAVVAIRPLYVMLLLNSVVPVAPAVSEPSVILVTEPDALRVPISIDFAVVPVIVVDATVCDLLMLYVPAPPVPVPKLVMYVPDNTFVPDNAIPIENVPVTVPPTVNTVVVIELAVPDAVVDVAVIPAPI